MKRHKATRKATLALALAAASLAFAGPSGATGGGVQLHLGNTEVEAPVVAGEPQVCYFHVHVFAVPATSYPFAITGGPAGVKISGTFTTDGAGQYRTAQIAVSNGEYQVVVNGPGLTSADRYQRFRVAC